MRQARRISHPQPNTQAKSARANQAKPRAPKMGTSKMLMTMLTNNQVMAKTRAGLTTRFFMH
jgi:hypothetical protein